MISKWNVNNVERDFFYIPNNVYHVDQIVYLVKMK